VSPAARVLQVVDSLTGGEVPQHVVDLAVELRSRGWEVTLACAHAGGPGGRPLSALTLLADHGVVVRSLCEDGGPLTAYAERLGALVDAVEPDVVHAHLHASATAAAQAVAARAVALVLTEHDQPPSRDIEARRASAAYLRRADRVLGTSRAIRAQLLGEHEVPASRLRPLVTVRGPADRPSRPAQRLAGQRRTIGFLGPLRREKGLDVLLRALPALLRSCPDVRLVVAGGGPEEPRAEQLAWALGVRDHVRLLGDRPDPLHLLAELDVLVVPSRHDGAPTVVHEAMRAGVPVVGSDVGGIRDRLEGGRYGVLVPPGHPDALAEALARLLLDPAARMRLAWAAARAAARHTFEGMVDVVEQVYAEVLADMKDPCAGEQRSPAP
jgi:glycosyltransferase involved in cell wall biosynthesis